jgi:DNA-binding PadR family transcriptional regulator
MSVLATPNSWRPAEIKRHLALPHNGWTTLQLRPKLEALQAAGLIKTVRRHSRDWWLPTNTGQQRLDALRRDDKLDELPESPQHKHWREARNAAGERITEFRGELHEILTEASSLLDAPNQTSSGTWCELGSSMQRATARLASAVYCLNEWNEPDDSHADIDDHPYGQGSRRHPDRSR